MPTLKGTEATLSYVQCFLNLLSSSIYLLIFHITWLDNFWTDLLCVCVCACVHMYLMDMNIMEYYLSIKKKEILQ